MPTNRESARRNSVAVPLRLPETDLADVTVAKAQQMVDVIRKRPLTLESIRCQLQCKGCLPMRSGSGATHRHVVVILGAPGISVRIARFSGIRSFVSAFAMLINTPQ